MRRASCVMPSSAAFIPCQSVSHLRLAATWPSSRPSSRPHKSPSSLPPTPFALRPPLAPSPHPQLRRPPLNSPASAQRELSAIFGVLREKREEQRREREREGEEEEAAMAEAS